MEYFKPFEEEMKLVFDEAKAQISGFPEPLNKLGLRYLNKFDVFQQDSAKNYICYLLPYWIREIAPINEQQTRKLAISGIFIMLHYFILDDCMDSEVADAKQKLAIGHLFYSISQRQFIELFDAESPFWTYLRQYEEQWAVCVTSENAADYFQTDLLRIADKAAPIISLATGALLLSDREHLVKDAEILIANVLVTLQMADDLADWKEDLADGSYNCLLSLVKLEYGITEGSPTEKQVNDAIFIRNMMKKYAETAGRIATIVKLSSVKSTHLMQFNQSICDNITNVAASLEQNRKQRMAGGFHYFLSNSTIRN
ncbi:hypothetical protein [Paenibacillus sp. NEAU-GSW1]|uniref:hypothetical protein n=1 Tax=Paenibacillus sp. NEAU-GSW1 TaxID=2682486 RepID=UPI0012E2F959|nr:hypothetical protein [Paenibacillus sp. NEAU-GSW1]MUT68434.1 hypothetical protein [Paenibacillus sp. NEAU-GSW1]